MVQILAPVSLGELIDKITILHIKSKEVKKDQLKNVNEELSKLEVILANINLSINEDLIKELEEVNSKLWLIEDEIREKERARDFGDEFIDLARSVYKQNDKRAAIKRKINISYGSELIEEKNYREY